MVQQALDAESWKDDIRVVSARPEWVTLDVRCKIDAADRTTHFLREIQADLPLQTREDIAVAFRELLMNAIEHGGKYDPRKRVRAVAVAHFPVGDRAHSRSRDAVFRSIFCRTRRFRTPTDRRPGTSKSARNRGSGRAASAS